MNNTTGKNILIIDDEPSLIKVLKEKLQSEGFEVYYAEGGEEGLKIALDTHPDLILLDIVMPHMDGIETLERIREDEWGKDAKVIVLTNLNDNEKLSRALELGSFEFLIKTDWKLEDVVLKIKERI